MSIEKNVKDTPKSLAIVLCTSIQMFFSVWLFTFGSAPWMQARRIKDGCIVGSVVQWRWTGGTWFCCSLSKHNLFVSIHVFGAAHRWAVLLSTSRSTAAKQRWGETVALASRVLQVDRTNISTAAQESMLGLKAWWLVWLMLKQDTAHCTCWKMTQQWIYKFDSLSKTRNVAGLEG